MPHVAVSNVSEREEEKEMRNRVRGIFAAAVAVLATGAAMAADSVTIPAMPVDFADVAAQGAVILGTVVAGVIGIFVIVSLVNMGIKWVKRAFNS